MRRVPSIFPAFARIVAPLFGRRHAGSRLASLVMFLVGGAIAAHAQSVHWEANDQSMPNAVQLVFEDCIPDGQPDLPAVPGTTFTFAGRAESMNIVNFDMTRSVTLSYFMRARQSGPAHIPSFTVKTNKGTQTVAAFDAATPAASLDSIASSRLVPERTSVWAGEVFGLNYELTAAQRNYPQIPPTFEWNSTPLVAEDWSKAEVSETIVGREREVVVVFRTRVTGKAPNKVKLEAANHLLTIQTGTLGLGIFSQPRMEQISVTSDQPVIEIRPLPPAPAGFSGAVGQFKLVSKVVPVNAAIGEPVTWTLELSGTGNWPDFAGLPTRDVSTDFHVVQPKAKRTPAEGKLFDTTLAEDIVLVPTKAGDYTLGPITFVYFDPKSGSYKTITAPSTALTITPPTAPQFNLSPQPAEPAPPPESSAPSKTPPATPAAPTGIPRDPLPGSATVMVPLARATLVLWVVAPFGGLLFFWAGLAIRQAKKTDPVRPRREARARLLSTLSHLPAAAEGDRAALLLAWQHDSAVLWQIRSAAPPATALPDAAWAALWVEADRALYGAKSGLPSDWVARAQEALAVKRVPGFRPLRAFLPQNLMPFAAALAFLLVAAPVLLRAAEAEPAAAYRSGDFAGAEKAWRAAVAQNPTDWIARHNLSLALAQQDRSGEATAQAAAAFVQHPADPSVQWHFTLAAEKAGFVPGPLAAFVSGGPVQTLARLASPATWQVAIVVTAFASAAIIAVMLLNAYGPRRRALSLGGSAALGLCAVSAAVAITSLFAYGLAADPRAVVIARAGTLRSIPTEADTTQKISPLAAGSMAVADKKFLGWTQLAFENGQTGWVRTEEFVPLWK